MSELWQPVQGYEGLYEVSDLGRVRSLERKANTWNGGRKVSQKELKQTKLNNGYLQVTLFKSGIRQKKSVHRIVAEAFLLRPVGADMVLHYDDNKENNQAKNLRWGCHADNMRDAVKNQRTLRGNKNKAAKLTENQVLAIFKDDRTQVAIARDYCVQRTTVQKIKSGESWSWLTKS